MSTEENKENDDQQDDINKIIFETVMEEIRKIKAEFSSANIIIAGKTGVGKSSLINAVFHGNLAKTGLGEPVTQEIEKFSHKEIPINIYDTKGLELEKYKDTLNELKEFISKLHKDEDSNQHIHLAWVCISESSARLEDGEKALIELLSEFKIPTIVVITKTSKTTPPLKEVLSNLIGDKVKDILPVSATGEELEEDDGNIIKLQPKGLKQLIEISYKYIPEGKRLAFTRSQKASLDLKKKNASNIINAAATAAAAAAASPIPFSDSALIIPIQVGMIVRITAVYGIPLKEGAVSSLASSVVGCTAATTVGRSVVGNLLKLIPGAGTIVGDVVNAATAHLLTKTLGELYDNILVAVYNESLEEGNPEINFERIIEKLKSAWENQ